MDNQEEKKIEKIDMTEHVRQTGELHDSHPALKGFENFEVGDKVSILVNTPTGHPVEGTIVRKSKIPGEIIEVELPNGWKWRTIPANILKV